MRSNIKARVALAALSAIGAATVANNSYAADCSTLTPPPVYVYGSSAVKPLIAALGASLYGTVNIVYIDKGGSCDGVNAIVKGNTAGGTGLYYPSTDDAGGAVVANCDVPVPDGGVGGVTVDLGVSDVWPETCNVTTDYNVVGDFHGPNQVMTFVAPKLADGVSNISAEAAYYVMGQPDNGKNILTWTDTTKLAIRSASSGTQSMLGKAIRLDASLWHGHNSGNSQGVETALSTANMNDAVKETTLGILSTGETDNDRGFLKVLAFQDFGSKCAYWPDTSLTTFDKINVRTGLYPVWGPLHLLAKVPSKGAFPTNATVSDIVKYFTGDKVPPTGPKQLIDLEIKAHTVPQCAMTKTRDTEMAPSKAFSPKDPCGCYFESKVAGGGPTKCTACMADADCADAGANMFCSYGFCEAKPQ
jgi:hypothetical protein